MIQRLDRWFEPVRRQSEGLYLSFETDYAKLLSRYLDRRGWDGKETYEEPLLELAQRHDNVVMTRTFSKIHGLAALRLGWAYVSKAMADVLNRIRGPFPTSPLQQQAGAAAIADTAHVARAAAHNAQWRIWLTDEIRKLGLRVDDSAANFVLIHFAPGAKDAKAADAFLIARGIILRGVGAYGLPDCLRLTVGTEEANRLVAAALRDFMAQ